MFGHLTYLVFEVAWAVPIVTLQWVVGWRELWPRRWLLLAAIGLPTVYLSLADGIAIAGGIWALHANRITGLRIGNLPIEEALFFLLTNALVAQSVVIVYTRRSWT